MTNEIDLRKAPRYPLDVRASVIFKRDDVAQKAQVRTVDVGIGGTAITSPLQLPLEVQVEVEFSLPNSRATMRLKAIIKNRSGFRYGVEFLSISDAQRDEITRFGIGRKPSNSLTPGMTPLTAC